MNLRDREVSLFVNKLRKSLSNYKELLIAINNKRNERVLESMLVEQFILSTTILWEAFINDLFVAYILMSPRHSLSAIKTRVLQSIKNKHGDMVLRYLKLRFPVKMNKAKVIGLHDQKGWNITASNASELRDLANRLLASKHAKKFSLTAEDSECYDFLFNLRNYLSHYSILSRKKLKLSIGNINSNSNAILKGNLRQIGPYLKYKNRAGESRAEFMVNRLVDLVQKL